MHHSSQKKKKKIREGEEIFFCLKLILRALLVKSLAFESKPDVTS